MWELRRLTTLWAFMVCYRDSFAFLPRDILPLSQFSEFLSLTPIFEADISEAIKRLEPSKSVGLNHIPEFVIKCCSIIFIPILRHKFNLSLTQQYLSAVWKEAASVLVFRSDDHVAVSNYFCSQ
jgi:hypothetical protein